MNDVINQDSAIKTSKDLLSIVACNCLLTPLVQEKMEINVLHIVATLVDTVMNNYMCKMEIFDALVYKAKT